MERPAGTVTFLFTDIEGSTRAWEEAPDEMRRSLQRHDAILRRRIDEAAGYIFSTAGDGFAVAFSRADQALAVAVAIQQDLAVESWPPRAVIRVRMGLHTGEAEERDGDYFGSAVNLTARLMAAAHGGQILCSGATAVLMSDGLDPTCRLRDLGSHHLRDLGSAVRVQQVVAAGLPDTFPALRSLDALPGNLPTRLTTFVGRHNELKALVELILDARIVTLTGVGGVGKTRLALAAGADLVPSFRDGVWFVELAGVGASEGVGDAVAGALGIAAIPGAGGRAIEDHLLGKELVVILDNCEHLLGPVAELVTRLTGTTPGIRVLATSREGLGVEGEHLVAVPSLELPRPGDDAAAIAATASARLFVERAQEVSSDFQFSEAEAPAVADLCRRLDGIPLAIELAAARVPAMTPAEIATHLDRRFKLLTGGRRGGSTRHQTLRNAIEWSYHLLDADEQTVLSRLAVFVGGFDLGAAHVVAATGQVDPVDVVDLVARLVGKSLLVAEPRAGATRYRLLETIRDFAWERLQQAEAEAALHRHALHFADFARRAGAGLRGPDEGDWRERVEREVDNLRAALAWAVGAGEAELALNAVSDLAVHGDPLAPFGLAAESAARLAPDHVLAPVALGAACFAAALQGNRDAELALAQEAMDRAEALDRSPEGLWVRCRVANGTCMTVATHGPGNWQALADRWLADARDLGDSWCLCEALTMRAGHIDPQIGRVAAEEALELARQLDAPSRIAFAAAFLAGRVAGEDPGRADQLFGEANEAAARARNDWVDFVIPTAMAGIQAQSGAYRVAAETAGNAIGFWAGRGLSGTITQFTGMLACLLAVLRDEEGALVLAAWSEQHGLVFPTDHPYWLAYGMAELAALRDGAHPADRDRASGAAVSIEEIALPRLAAERLGRL